MDRFGFSEKVLSQLPAMHLLQALGYQLLTKAEADRERHGRLSNVLLDSVLADRLRDLNRATRHGSNYPFSESAIQEAIERLKIPRPSGLLRTNEELTDLLLLGTSIDQAIDGETRGDQ